MISADRFIARSSDHDLWMDARAGGVTATQVAKAATPSGFDEAVRDLQSPVEIIPNGYMEFGTANEDWIALALKREHDLLPNCWLIAADDEPRFLATPDALALDHQTVGEIKTGGKWGGKIPLAHVRQMQWQMRCTGAAFGVYAFMLRLEVNGVFVPAWTDPEYLPLDRDDQMIAALEATAYRLLDVREQIAA